VQHLGTAGNGAAVLSTYDSIVYWLGNGTSNGVEQFILREILEQVPGVLVGTASTLLECTPSQRNLATALLVTDEQPELGLILTPVRVVSSDSIEELAETVNALIVEGERAIPLRRLASELSDVLADVGIERDMDIIDEVATCVEDLFGGAEFGDRDDGSSG
jgi:hypothetical protein